MSNAANGSWSGELHRAKLERGVTKILSRSQPRGLRELPVNRFQDTDGSGSDGNTPRRISDRVGCRF